MLRTRRPQQEAERPQPRAPASTGPVDQHQALVRRRDGVGGHEVGMDERVRQVIAVIGPVDCLAEPVKYRQLPGRHLADRVIEQVSGGGNLLAWAATE